MKIIALVLSIATAVFTLTLTASHAQANTAEGLWLTENERSVIQVEKCGEELCGYIYWIIEGGMQFDAMNPDETKRDIPMCGLKIMYGLTQDVDAPSAWENGYIYKADEGDLYNAKLEILDDNQLKVRGYIGFSFLGKSQIWTRVTAKEYPQCQQAGR